MRKFIPMMPQKVVCPAILALPAKTLSDAHDGQPVSAIIPQAYQEWLRHCETDQLTCIVKGGRQRYRQAVLERQRL